MKNSHTLQNTFHSILPPCDIIMQLDNMLTGGLETVVIDLAISLQKQGHNVALLAFGNTGADAEKAQAIGLSVCTMPYDEQTLRQQLAAVKPKVVFAHYSFQGSHIYAELGIPFYQVVHNVYTWLDDAGRKTLQNTIVNTAKFIAVSPIAREYTVHELGVPEHKCITIANGIEIQKFAPLAAEQRATKRMEMGYAADDYIFISVASINRIKRQLTLVKSFHLASLAGVKAKLLIIGHTYDTSYLQEISHYIEQHNLQERVQYIGHTRTPEDYYAIADCQLHGAAIEGGPLTLLEALTANLSVVITNVGFAPLFTGHQGVYVVERNFPYTHETFSNQDFLNGGPQLVADLTEAIIQAYTKRMRPDLPRETISLFDCQNTYAAYANLIAGVKSTIQTTSSFIDWCELVQKKNIATGKDTDTTSTNYVSPFNALFLLAAERDEQLRESNRTIATRDAQLLDKAAQIAAQITQVSILEAQIAERDAQLLDKAAQIAAQITQVSILEAQIAERDAQLMERNAQIVEQQVSLSELTNTITGLYNSKSWKITAPLRKFKQKTNGIKEMSRLHLVKKFLKTVKHHGIYFTLKKTYRYIFGTPDAVVQINSTQIAYIVQPSIRRVKLALQGIATSQAAQIIHECLKNNNADMERIVLYPLSYPLELRQRPDHIFRTLRDQGYTVVIMAEHDQSEPFVKTLEPNLILTNMYFEAIAFFHKTASIFYITSPLYRYVYKFLSNAIVIYDILDDLTIYDGQFSDVVDEHNKIVNEADILLFSATMLLDVNKLNTSEDIFLVTNGVWAKDFILAQNEEIAPLPVVDTSRKLIGYHGVVSDLLDWDLLDDISNNPQVNLLFVGPIADFIKSFDGQMRQKVLSKPNVYHIKYVDYFELKRYLCQLDAAIIPFIINELTDPVSPLKLFEYMALGLPVFATPTKTLNEYSKDIMVHDRTTMAAAIQTWACAPANKYKVDYSTILQTVDWANQMQPVIERCKTLSIQKKNRQKTVDFININFFDWEGETVYKGGAERYIYDLACICLKNKWQPRILQNAYTPFSKVFKGIPVEGVPLGTTVDFALFSRKISEQCTAADLVIASPLEMASACELPNVIGINHGIHWDHAYPPARYEEAISSALENSSTCVCVDTNFINWVRTKNVSLASKLQYIPNYYDAEQFYPQEKDFTGEIRILYPRRLFLERGIFITLEAFEALLPTHPDIILHLVGQTSEDNAQILQAVIDKHPKKIIWDEFDMEDMHKAYETSHIALVPTIQSEGTSLSCIEAMATNNAIIATNVGGLPNLIINDFNGLLIAPTTEELIFAIESLLRDREKMQQLAANALLVAPAFEKKKWEKQWEALFKKHLQPTD